MYEAGRASPDQPLTESGILVHIIGRLGKRRHTVSSSGFSAFCKFVELPFLRLSNAVAAARIIMVPVLPGGGQQPRRELLITRWKGQKDRYGRRVASAAGERR